MRLILELSDYSLHEWIESNVSDDPEVLEKTLEAAISIYCRNISNLEIEGRVLMRYELTDAAIGHRLQRWLEANSRTLPYDELIDHLSGFTSVNDVRHIDGRTFSINIR